MAKNPRNPISKKKISFNFKRVSKIIIWPKTKEKDKSTITISCLNLSVNDIEKIVQQITNNFNIPMPNIQSMKNGLYRFTIDAKSIKRLVLKKRLETIFNNMKIKIRIIMRKARRKWQEAYIASPALITPSYKKELSKVAPPPPAPKTPPPKPKQ